MIGTAAAVTIGLVAFVGVLTISRWCSELQTDVDRLRAQQRRPIAVREVRDLLAATE